jgi:aldehyde:ferredoxin oxidoreductase
MAGWTETLLEIDLTARAARKKPLDGAAAALFLGGRGINTLLLYGRVSAQTDPLSPDNVIVFGTGPLSGTLAPSCGRCTVSAKSPLTGILGDANFGGFFAPALKKAGYDHLIIRGRADKPVYLVITDEGVQFKDAAHIWGKTTSQAEALLRQEIGGPRTHIALIGPAGENSVYTACVVHHHNVAGRTGMGAVMGSKNLKAVCVQAGPPVAVARPDSFKKIRRRWLDKIRDNPFCSFFSTYGSAGPLDKEAEAGILVSKNFSITGDFPGIATVSAGNLKKYFTGSHACFACPVHCIQAFRVTDGPYAGTTGVKMPEGCNSSCGPTCGNTDPGSLFMLNNLANDYGLDILDFGLLMGTAMDWYEHGIIGTADTGGIELNWGDPEAMAQMMENIALRRGFGSVLADGAVNAARRIGGEAEKYVSSSKGMVFGGVDVRVLRGSALCYATASRGADHLRGGLLFELPSKDGMNVIPPEEARERFGTEEVLNPLSYKKETAAVFCQDMYTIADCIEVCKFITAHNGHGITMQDMADMLSAVTGRDFDTAALHTIAERVYTLERAFLVRQGIRKKDDFLRGKWVSGPIPGGRFAGEEIDTEAWSRMLSAYYRLRGWDPETGVPTPETLNRLGLKDIVSTGSGG